MAKVFFQITKMMVLLCLCFWVENAFSNQVPPSLLKAINDLSYQMNDLVMNGDLGLEYVPQVVDLGQEVVASIQNHFSSSPRMGNTAKIADALSRMADFAEYIEKNPVKVGCYIVSVIAAGIVVGKLANKYIFPDGEKNIFSRISDWAYSGLCNACNFTYEVLYWELADEDGPAQGLDRNPKLRSYIVEERS